MSKTCGSCFMYETTACPSNMRYSSDLACSEFKQKGTKMKDTSGEMKETSYSLASRAVHEGIKIRHEEWDRMFIMWDRRDYCWVDQANNRYQPSFRDVDQWEEYKEYKESAEKSVDEMPNYEIIVGFRKEISEKSLAIKNLTSRLENMAFAENELMVRNKKLQSILDNIKSEVVDI